MHMLEKYLFAFKRDIFEKQKHGTIMFSFSSYDGTTGNCETSPIFHKKQNFYGFIIKLFFLFSLDQDTIRKYCDDSSFLITCIDRKISGLISEKSQDRHEAPG